MGTIPRKDAIKKGGPLDLKIFEKRMKSRNSYKANRRDFIGRYSLTEDELNRLYAEISSIRDLAIIKLAVSTGIRREDIAALELANIDWDNAIVHFYEQKKRRPWQAYILPDALTALRMYVNTLDKREKYLFPGRTKKPPSKDHLTGRAIYDIFNGWLPKAGLETRPSHALRSTCMKLLQLKGWSPEQVQEQTGDTLEVIQMHYTVPTRAEMIDTARRTL